MFREDTSCIILAGGLGTRLRGSIGDIPKCMAPVAGTPFLQYLFSYLESQGIRQIMLSLGYRAEVVLDWLPTQSRPFEIGHVQERAALGTGGGIVLAMQQCSTPAVFVINGDTYFDVDLQHMYASFQRAGAETMLALKELREFERYGTVRLEPGSGNGGAQIVGFQEKQPTEKGWINGGVYCINREAFLKRPFPETFSFEKEYLEKQVYPPAAPVLYGYQSDGYFIDIGVPEDFQRAQTDFQTLFPA